jgi:hypothetical protein
MGGAPVEELPDPLTLVHAPRLAHPTAPLSDWFKSRVRDECLNINMFW